ncbi:tRNA synthetases class II (A)-domain-containing protein [Xylaria sp. FL0064]|nr:tRNA synthetases class II (A)-domain-containing protein [Xylaria sp. FL0064]
MRKYAQTRRNVATLQLPLVWPSTQGRPIQGYVPRQQAFCKEHMNKFAIFVRRCSQTSRGRASIMAHDTRWTAAEVRKTFLDFFAQREHTIVPSAPVVPNNDPTLLFVNAGMNQFKPVFLGTVARTDPLAQLKRATNSQKCIRAGGKHNDLDDVGKDSYHHTFFEMLGNWSFGDYFKKEAISMSWELLTKVFGLDPNRLYVTYFEGNTELGLEPDLEAKALWEQVGVRSDHILPGSMKDNFWEMGDQGPCGPCSEVHYDKIGGRNASHLVNQDDPMVVEVWNNVFMQFDRQKDKSLKILPAKHIDTGMGFERLVSALQDKTSNYATDIFTPLFKKIEEVTHARPYSDKYGPEDADGIDTAYRVCADHLRLLSFAIADGAVPNNIGRGYVVRRVLRRGVRYARKYLKAEIGSFFSSLLPALLDEMGEHFPELRQKEKEIKEILDEEEVAFALTLDRGERQFEKYAEQALKTDKKLAGSDVWRLYDTFGFPEDLTKLMASDLGILIDENEVRVAEEKAREASKAVQANLETFSALDVHQIAQLESEGVPRTDSEAKYKIGDLNSIVKRVFMGKQGFECTTETVPTKTPLGLLLDKTNFYAESGGQVGDTGRIVIGESAVFDVFDVQEYGGYVLHNGYVESGQFSEGDEVTCIVDELRRSAIRANHTGTHIVNHALREVLGDDVHQKGSLVDQDKLRFDFSHKTGINPTEMKKIHDLCQKEIAADYKTYAKDVSLNQAREIEGLRAVFGETYPDPVRVISIGVDVDDLLKDPSNSKWRQYSVELCGGTHVESTRLIKDLIIVEESGIAKGVRRIIAFTGERARAAQREAQKFAETIEQMEKLHFGPEMESAVKVASTELATMTISTLERGILQDRFGKVQKKVTDEQKKRQKAESSTALRTVQDFFKANPESMVWVGHLGISANAKAVADVLNHFKASKNPDDKARSVYVFAGSSEETVMHGVYVGQSLTDKGLTAEAWTDVVLSVIGGKAGGKGTTRQGAGAHPEKLDEAIREAQSWISEKI